MKSIKSLLIILVIPFFSFAWNGIGHSTGGAIAYYYLKANDPQTLAKVLEALKSHPWYNKTTQGNSRGWADKLVGLTEEQKDVTVFMLASTFPDDARMSSGLGGPIKAKWHYIDYPFVPVGQTVTGTPPESPNAEEKINELLTTIKSESDPQQKAIDICWLCHLIEDVHQPLHTAALFNTDHPHGDKGGNDTFIQFNGASSTKLHSYWDGLIKGTLTTVPANAAALLKKPAYKETNLPELTSDVSVHDWITKESFIMAKTNAYKNGTINGLQNSPTNVDATYSSASGIIAERRIVLAGIRLAKKLSSLFV